jgi:hypothetical protein
MIAWSVMTLAISFTLLSTIHKFISEKATINMTLVDLIYRDAIVYLYMFCLFVYLGVILSILSYNESLNIKITILFSLLIYTFFDCVFISFIISGSLRFISLVKLSEESGLQLLGPDNLAIVRVRFISVAISVMNRCQFQQHFMSRFFIQKF